ncbi:MAG TPA: molybdopterin cofactor-binding domain-containing protein [Amycolatopsis sp.]|nr:molybdopterin cofactor-binding domain-containing protein [Amycolatopsis sp.]
MTLSHSEPDTGQERSGVSRRGFLGYVVAAGTLVVAADVGLTTSASAAGVAAAALPSLPQPPELYDLNDALTDAGLPTSQLITVTINKDGSASFEIPRSEVGQGITTSTAMIIAEELDLPAEKVHVTLAPARPELLFNQLTGGSNTTVSTYTPIRVAAAIARQQLLQAAVILLGGTAERFIVKGGVITAPSGKSVTYGELATKAASSTTKQVTLDPSKLKSANDFKVLGKPQNRLDAHDIVTGRKQFAMDLDIPGALPTMLCRPPRLNGTPKAIRNKADVLKLPGVTDVAIIPTGVAVRAETFGQCIDGVRALQVDWGPGSVEGENDETVLANLRRAELPLAVPKVPILAKTIEADFEFMFRSSAALEPYCAVADVRDGSAEIWAGLKSPIVTQGEVAQAVGLPQGKVKVHVITGGGSFGHKLFGNHAIEAAQASKAFGKPVRLMWHRADEPRQGRLHPMATSRMRATVLAGNVLTFEQRHTSVETSFRHGLGEMLTSVGTKLPTGLGNLGVAEAVFVLSQEMPYNFGAVDQTLTETDQRFNTGSMRNVYSPDVGCANELMVDILAQSMGKDPLAFRLEFLKSDKVKGVLRKVAEVGGWGKKMAPGTAQGIAIHKEYKGASACLVEIDYRPETVNRKIRDGVGGPRVTKAVIALDAGLVINPRGIEAQMMGGAMDAIGQILTESLHLKDGYFLEGSWDDYYYTRQWNVPFDVNVIVMPPSSDSPGGVGEFPIAVTKSAVACALARATGKSPSYFPINHLDPLPFTPFPTEPSIPPSPKDGLHEKGE